MEVTPTTKIKINPRNEQIVWLKETPQAYSKRLEYIVAVTKEVCHLSLGSCQPALDVTSTEDRIQKTVALPGSHKPQLQVFGS